MSDNETRAQSLVRYISLRRNTHAIAMCDRRKLPLLNPTLDSAGSANGDTEGHVAGDSLDVTVVPDNGVYGRRYYDARRNWRR